SQTVSYTVSYDMFLLYDPTKPTNTITLQLRDGNGVNVSAPSIVLTVQSIDTTPQSGTFTYQKTMGGQYKYSLPRNLASGSHTLPAPIKERGAAQQVVQMDMTGFPDL